MSGNKPQGRRNVALAICIIMGLVIGVFIKRVPIGLLIGVVIGVLVGGMWVSRK
jgi:uncharacterized protein YqgC (DUF456 family)